MKKTIWYAGTDNGVRFFDSEECINKLRSAQPDLLGNHGSFTVEGSGEVKITGIKVETIQDVNNSLEQVSAQS